MHASTTLISDVSEYETDDPDSDNDYGALGRSNHCRRYINYDVTTSDSFSIEHMNYWSILLILVLQLSSTCIGLIGVY